MNPHNEPILEAARVIIENARRFKDILPQILQKQDIKDLIAVMEDQTKNDDEKAGFVFTWFEKTQGGTSVQ